MLNERSQEKELIDLGSDYYSLEEYEHCLKMLFRVNQVFGFFYSTKKFLKKFSKKSSVLDIGCGGGLFLLGLSQHFPEMQLKGIDISHDAIRIAQQELKSFPKKNVAFELQKNNSLDFPDNSVDIILATLVCHHLSDDELINFFQETLRSARHVVILNDLHRHSLAHWVYSKISPLLFRNRLISHDGLISIRRAFTRQDWKILLQKAGISHYEIKWCFPFRWRVVLWKK